MADLKILDLGRKSYGPVLEIQEALVAKRKLNEITDTLVLVEHDPVYTLGRNADRNNVLLSPGELEQMGLSVVPVGRGGDVTYHGPGQLVVYPVLHLGKRVRKVVGYVEDLEKVILLTLADFGVKGSVDRANRGVWVGNEKIAAIGVRVTGGVTMHGFALNVRVNLDHYAGIIPCGIRDRGVTSLDKMGVNVSMEEVKTKVVENFVRVFDCDIK